jgi:mono/diheme cytochrome c family protein
MRLPSLGVITLIGLFLSGCATESNRAFPTAEVTAQRTGTDVAMLARGRTIYTTTCTECHVARPVNEFSASQWRVVVGDMAPRARLDPADRLAVESYLVAASSVQ